MKIPDRIERLMRDRPPTKRKAEERRDRFYTWAASPYYGALIAFIAFLLGATASLLANEIKLATHLPFTLSPVQLAFGFWGAVAIWLVLFGIRQAAESISLKRLQDNAADLANNVREAQHSINREIEHTKNLASTTQVILDKTQAVADSLSTKFIADFPGYLPKVGRLITDSKYTIRIMGIVPSHGEYSNPKHWHDISKAITDKIEDNTDNSSFEAILVYSAYEQALRAFKTHHRELEDPEKWRFWKQEEKASGRLDRYLYKYEDLASDIADDLSNLSLDRYLRLRIDGDRRAISQTYKGFKRQICPEVLPMFCWIADGHKESQQAIFSIRAEDATGHYKGAGVVTSDPSIIDALITTFDYYQTLSTTDDTPRWRS